MSRRIYQSTSWLILCLISLRGITQSSQQLFKITNWFPEIQMPLGVNYTILKDSLGFLWLTSPEGLMKFDGSSFKIYRSTDKPSTILGGETLGLIEDSMHNIWIGSNSGLNRYDIHADQFQTFPLVKQNISGTNYFIPFYATKDEVWYIDRNAGLLAINIRSLAKRVLFSNVPPVTYYARQPYTFYDSSSQSIWYPAIEAVLRFSLKDGKSYTTLPGDNDHLLGKLKRLSSIINDTLRHCVWFSDAGLYKLDISARRIQPCGSFSDSSLRVSALCLDKQNRLWIGTRTQGIFIYDPEKNTSQHILRDPGSPNSLQSNYVRSIYCDRDGMIWVGLGVGIDQLTNNTAIRHYSDYSGSPHGLISPSVRAFAEDKRKKIWIATMDGGINIFDPAHNTFSYLTKKDLPGMPSDRIRTICIDTVLNTAYVSADFGPGELNIRTKKYKRIIFKDVEKRIVDTRAIWASHWVPMNDSTWILGAWQGIYLYKKQSDTAYQQPFLTDKNISYIGKGNDICFFTSSDLLPEAYSYSGNKWIYLGKLFGNLPVLCVVWDDRLQTWWVASSKGLYHLTKNFKIIRHYSVADGLPDNWVNAIVIDKNGLFWLGTSKGLCTLDTATDRINDIGAGYGIRNGYSQAFLLTSNGDIFMHSGDGFDWIQPSRITYHFPPAKIYFKSLDIDKKDLPAGVNINLTSKISLKYFQNNIDIETGVLDFYSQGKNSIRYKLKGLSDEWQSANTSYHIHYGGLAPGTYEFVMQAANASNEWNGPVKTIKFIISPPFWQTSWFRVLVVLLVLLGFYAIYSYRVRQLKKLLSLRAHISRDLHDEVGATLSGISIIGKMAKQNLQTTKAKEVESLLDKIIENSTEMLSKMSDIVWAINPSNDSFEQIVSRLRNSTHSAATPMGVTLNFEIERNLDQYNLDMQQRKNIYLIGKEAINNSLKYSQCKTLSVRIGQENHRFRIAVQDDGKGFDKERRTDGNGLRNMRARAEEIKAKLIIESNPDKGTLIELFV